MMPFSPKEMSPSTLKGIVHRLQKTLAENPAPPSWPPKQATCQEWIAKALNFQNWHEAIHVTQAHQDMALNFKNDPIVSNHPLLQIFLAQNKSFQVDFSTCFVMAGDLRASLFESFQSPHTLLMRGYQSLYTNPKNESIALFMSSLFEWWFQNLQLSDIPHLAITLVEESGTDNQMWKNRALFMCSVALEVEIQRRRVNPALPPLSFKDMSSIFGLKSLIQHSKDHTLPLETLDKLQSYLFSIPGYSSNLLNPSETAVEMHGYLEMQISKALTNLPIPNLKALERPFWNLFSGKEAEFPLLLKVFKPVFPRWLKSKGISHLMIDGLGPHSPWEEVFLSFQGLFQEQHICVWWGWGHIDEIRQRSSFLNGSWFERIVSMGAISPRFQQSLKIIDQEQLLTFDSFFQGQLRDERGEPHQSSYCYVWSSFDSSFKTAY